MQPQYISSPNRTVEPAAPDEFKPLSIGPHSIWPPVVLAPMAGVTNPPFRTLCQEFGAGLYVSEMITVRPLLQDHEKTVTLASFHPSETIRSLQLYGVEPPLVGQAVRRLVEEDRVDHIDLNFGCPVRKVTRKGGGSAVPVRPRLLQRIVREAVQNAGEVPVTIKVRLGIDEELMTYQEAGRIAESEGCAAIALHARTAAELYNGHARWHFIGALKEQLSIPVLGNGDIWEARDALRMMRQTGCDGVVVGRGCLGRPWLFRDLSDLFHGREEADPPCFGEIARIMMDHAQRMADWLGEELGMLRFRKHAAWYTKGFPGSASLRPKLQLLHRLEDLERLLGEVDPSLPFPPEAMRVPRAKTAGTQEVALPPGYREDRSSDQPWSRAAGDWHSGG